MERYLQQKIHNDDKDWYMIMIDVDRFKAINDNYGHLEGDRTLQYIAQSLKNILGVTDSFISRYGGDEFVVIVNSITNSDIDMYIEQCQSQLNNLLNENNVSYNVQLSSGYVKFVDELSTPMNKLIQLADKKMYKQKRKRRNEFKKEY